MIVQKLYNLRLLAWPWLVNVERLYEFYIEREGSRTYAVAPTATMDESKVQPLPLAH